ncbi:MAG: hypothetical protein J2O48_02975 [Solirubrobacterales bacterium]|nr:hypothetical protein [Solirubrobacterales bacterium]
MSTSVEQERALSDEQLTTAAPEVLAGSLSEYGRAQLAKIKNGESGALPVLIGLIAIVIFFQLERSQFLTAQNLVNLLVQATIFIMFGAAEIFVLLLSEIDLSVGYGAGVGAFIITELIASPVNLPWWVGVLGGLFAMALLGGLQGLLVAKLGLPSFIVTLGGYLAFNGLMEEIANADKTAVGGVINIDNNSPIYKLVNSHMTPTLGWIVMIVCVLAYAAYALARSRSRRAQGLTTAPLGVTLLGIGAAAVAGIVLMLICNSNQSLTAVAIRGMPWVIPFVLAVMLVASWFMSRTRTGRYIYAVGNSPEAARRAGIKVQWITMLGFVLSSVTGCLAGLIYASNQGSMSIDINGGQFVLFAVAAAVIGGTSLFGGRGKIMNALLGGVVIAAVFNGLGLMGVSTAIQDIVTAIVLVLALVMDSLVRRRATVAGR